MIEKIKKLIFTSYHPSYEFLAFYRIFFSLYLLWMGLSNANWVSRIPNSAMHPPISILSFTDAVPPEWFFSGCYYGMYLCLLLILIGLKPRVFSILYMIMYIMTSNYAFSFGKIDHSFVYVLPIIFMAFSPWNTTYSFFPELKRETDVLSKSWPMFLLSMLLGFGIFTAGLAKILGGWLNTDMQSTQVFFYQYRYGVGWHDLMSDFYDKINSQFFWEMLDYCTVFFESIFLVAFLKPKFFRFMIWITLFFHLNVLLMFNISFTFSIGFYALFIPTDLIPSNFKAKFKHTLQTIFQPKYKIVGIVFVILYLLLLIIFDINTINYLISKFFELFESLYAFPLFVLGGAFLFGTYLFIRSFRKYTS
ncbi:HTTM domain-containing protein [Chryseobacterium paridis]|uniref:HTTM domain-containing protein n=1 Tax=Chryseobacterium paridis TaxID=2800328 RepID=A0ABS1G086_9FLAO|nr:HTTM domain-containing protein [Chryseobacterium paridis]MBK1898101.1 HTTM domain-containing protein [Chryseobacterium paridis]